MKDEIEHKLRSILELDDSQLLGCRRRSAWAPETPWSWLRGNALLHTISDKHTTYTPQGPLEAFIMHSRWLLQFRGGQWNTYWTEDFYDLWALIKTYGSLPDFSNLILVLHENQGSLDIKQVIVPEAMNPLHRAERVIAEAASDPPGRIPKSGARAHRVCPSCPVKSRCDMLDKARAETTDWAPTYPTP